MRISALEMRSKWHGVIARWRSGEVAQTHSAARYGVPSTGAEASRQLRIYERMAHFSHGRNGGLRGACTYIVDLEDGIRERDEIIRRGRRM